MSGQDPDHEGGLAVSTVRARVDLEDGDARHLSEVQEPVLEAAPAPEVDAPSRKMTQVVVEFVTLVDRLADGQWHSEAAIERLTGTGRDRRRFLEKAAFVPWLTVQRSPAGTRFVIQAELRRVCEWYAYGVLPLDGVKPVLPVTAETTPREFVRAVRDEMTRQRKANNDLYKKAVWRNDVIDNRKMSALFDWVVDQLGRIP